jgi:hypothetical protein
MPGVAVRKPSQAKEGIEMKKRMKTISSVGLAAMLALAVTQNSVFAKDQACSNASLKGSYGFYSPGFDVPARTPRLAVGRETFDGNGNYTNTVTINDNGTVIRINDSGHYTVNADCTGTIFTAVGVTVVFVLVDGGKEIYRLIFAGAGAAADRVQYTVSKKQFPDE